MSVMASQPLAPNSAHLEITSFIQEYPVYQDVPTVSEVLLLQREHSSIKDNQAVSMMTSSKHIHCFHTSTPERPLLHAAS